MCKLSFGSIISFMSYRADEEKPTDRRTDRPTDRRTDRQAHSYITPLNFVWGGIIKSFHRIERNQMSGIAQKGHSDICRQCSSKSAVSSKKSYMRASLSAILYFL